MIYFIADLHLSPQAEGATAIFERFLAKIGQDDHRLFILGDFFETWVGDDDLADPFHQRIASVIHQASTAGLQVFLMHGNRDFLLGEQFADAAGCRLIPDPFVLSTPEWQFVLSHGDALCTDDVAYQAFRQQTRDPVWQAAFLAKPLTERRAIATSMRAQSQREKQSKTYDTMDLNLGATEDFLRQHGYATFIHGHTHHPAQHDHIVDGIHVERWVLSDWHEDQAEALYWDGEQLQRLPLY